MKSKVSILIPVYNREKIIKETIQSALSQTYENIEIIIVDNCSTDKTYEVCNKYAIKDERIKVYKNEENIGPVRNWIECLKYSTGEYVKILWSDDWMDSDFIEKTLPYLEREEVAFSYSPAYIVYEDEQILTYNIFNNDEIFDSKIFETLSIFGGNVPLSPGCALFRKKDVLDNLMLQIPNEDNLVFNRFGAGNDVLLFLLPLLKYKKVAYVYSVKSYFRAHKDSFSCSNNLNLYYDWARLYYLNAKKDNQLLKKFKTMLWCKSLKNRDYKNINRSITGGISYSYLFKKAADKIFR